MSPWALIKPVGAGLRPLVFPCLGWMDIFSYQMVWCEQQGRIDDDGPHWTSSCDPIANHQALGFRHSYLSVACCPGRAKSADARDAKSNAKFSEPEAPCDKRTTHSVKFIYSYLQKSCREMDGMGETIDCPKTVFTFSPLNDKAWLESVFGKGVSQLSTSADATNTIRLLPGTLLVVSHTEWWSSWVHSDVCTRASRQDWYLECFWACATK